MAMVYASVIYGVSQMLAQREFQFFFMYGFIY